MGEAGHWYDPVTGKLISHVPYADKARAGEMRDTTLRDARKMGLLPSVTTILGLVDKPGLRVWAVRHAIQTALLYGTPSKYEATDYVRQIVEAHEERGKNAAELGTQIHKGIGLRLEDKRWDDIVAPEVSEVVDGFFPWYESFGLELVKSEHSFISPLGFAGTVDYIGVYTGEDKKKHGPVIADFKTQDFDNIKEANFYDEHVLQLAGYAVGTGNTGHKRLSIIISRTVPGLVAAHWWDDTKRWDASFKALWRLWKLMKNYDPKRFIHEEEATWQPEPPAPAQKAPTLNPKYLTLGNRSPS